MRVECFVKSFAVKDFLKSSEIEELKADHRAERESRYADRIKAILMLNSGYSAGTVAECLLLNETTVRRYLQRYVDGGLEELCTDWHQGRVSVLSLDEEDALVAELKRVIYPTASSVIEFISGEFGVTYSVSGVRYLLKRLGFSYKKPQTVPGKANAEAQEEFLADLSALKDAKRKEDPILYMDGVHPQHNSHPDYGWLPKGEETKLKSNAGRQRVTLNGALNSETNEIHVREEQVLNSENTVEYFKELEAAYPDAVVIYIILDNAGYYRGKKIRSYLENSKIKLLHLPPYAPNLNLIERVWKFFKKKVLANRYYESFLEFKTACLDFFEKKNWNLYQAELKTLLVPNFQITGK